MRGVSWLSLAVVVAAIVDINRDGRLDIVMAGNDPDPSGTTFNVRLARCVR
jgi:hypothetical protein